jgi:anti-sigma factor RsiW
MSSPCRDVGHLMPAYLDGELSAAQMLEVEKHTVTCSTCAERILLDRAMRASVRKEVLSRKADRGLHDRVAASLAAERARSTWLSPGADEPGGPRTRAWGWRSAFLVAAAFAVAVPVGLYARNHNLSILQQPVHSAAASIDLDALMEKFVDWHAHALPPETTSTNNFTAFEPYVGVPVRPPTFTTVSARLVGGRMLPVPSPAPEQRVTAMLQYTTPHGNRISVYVYDPRRVRTSPSRLEERVLDSEPLYVGHVGGYAVAAGQRRGIGYAVASDLDDDANAALAAAAGH